jgi:hypothetical protein
MVRKSHGTAQGEPMSMKLALSMHQLQ